LGSKRLGASHNAPPNFKRLPGPTYRDALVARFAALPTAFETIPDNVECVDDPSTPPCPRKSWDVAKTLTVGPNEPELFTFNVPGVLTPIKVAVFEVTVDVETSAPRAEYGISPGTWPKRTVRLGFEVDGVGGPFPSPTWTPSFSPHNRHNFVVTGDGGLPINIVTVTPVAR